MRYGYRKKRYRRRSGQSTPTLLIVLFIKLMKMLLMLIVSFAILLYQLFSMLIQVIPNIIHFFWSIWGYGKTEYAKVTHRPLLQLIFDKGAYGEYLIYRHLDRKLTGDRKWLFNAYLPRSKSRTTEIDVMLFHSSGIYVFESKNYKGWIFGTETRKIWTQCIKPSEHTRTRKYHFLNPIMQNKLHLSAFSALLSDKQKAIPVHSVILFGNRCNLKKIDLSSGRHTVIRLKDLPETVQSMIETTPNADMTAVNAVYELLYPMTQVSEDVKQKHIADIEAELQRENTIAEEEAEGIPAPASEETEKNAVTVPADVPVKTEDQTAEAEAATDTTTVAEMRDEQEHICPHCGGRLVTRTVSKGERKGETFVGCSNFPKCRYTK